MKITSPAGEDQEGGKTCSIQELHGKVHMLCFGDLCKMSFTPWHNPISTLCCFFLFCFLLLLLLFSSLLFLNAVTSNMSYFIHLDLTTSILNSQPLAQEYLNYQVSLLIRIYPLCNYSQEGMRSQIIAAYHSTKSQDRSVRGWWVGGQRCSTTSS